jgi:hypothetical protein
LGQPASHFDPHRGSAEWFMENYACEAGVDGK